MIMEIIDKIKRNVERIQTITKSSSTGVTKCWYDIAKLIVGRRFSITELHDFELDRFPESYSATFLNAVEQEHYLSLLNPRKYYSLARNKYWTHMYFDQMGVSEKAVLYCYYNPELTFSHSQSIGCTLENVLEILCAKNVDECMIKTTESSHGDNVILAKSIRYENGDAILVNHKGEQIRLSEVLGKTPLIFESLIKQSDQFASFNPSSVNTVRFMTTLMPDGTARTIACFIKIGRAGSCVDNAGAGGNVDTSVDVETGEIQYPILFNGWRQVSDIECHPDTGTLLNGVKIENWENIRKKVESFQQALPFVKAAGWDIAITSEGPVIIEVNDMWDRTGQLFIRRGWKPEIKACYDAWTEYYSK